MFYADYHVHSNFSSDCDVPMELMIQAAITQGLTEIAITDHIDYRYPDPNFPFLFDYETYAETIAYLQEKYKKEITIRIGVEFGLQGGVLEETTAFYKQNQFDFVIGSTHCVQGTELYGNAFYQGKTQYEAYLHYFEDLLNNVKLYDLFNVYGHMDYVNRYGDYGNRELDYSTYADIIDEILRTLVAKGKGLEINTSGFKYGLGHAHPKLPILKRFKELGGEIVTVGSDSHSPKYLTSHFQDAYEMLRAAGFTAITVFDKQQPKWIDIK